MFRCSLGMVDSISSVILYNNYYRYIVGLGNIKGDGSTPFATVTFDNTTRNMVYYFMFGGLWK